MENHTNIATQKYSDFHYHRIRYAQNTCAAPFNVRVAAPKLHFSVECAHQYTCDRITACYRVNNQHRTLFGDVASLVLSHVNAVVR